MTPVWGYNKKLKRDVQSVSFLEFSAGYKFSLDMAALCIIIG